MRITLLQHSVHSFLPYISSNLTFNHTVMATPPASRTRSKTSMITKDPFFDDSEVLLDFLFTLRPPDLSTTPINEGALKLLQEVYHTFLARATVEEDNALEDRALAQKNGSTEDNDFECCTEVLRALGNIENACPRYRCRGKKPCSYLGFNTVYAKSDLHKQCPSMRLLVEPRDPGCRCVNVTMHILSANSSIDGDCKCQSPQDGQ
jgi:hypothetical protein